MQAAVLDTKRLRLRPIQAADAAQVARIMSPAVTRWLASWPDPVTETVAGERIAQSHDATRRGGHIWWAVVHRADQRVIGGLNSGLTAPDSRRMEISYHLAEAYHGAGYMREAAEVGVDALWRLFPGVDAIEAGAQVANRASFNIMQALGMTPIGDRPIYGSARDRMELCTFYELRRLATAD